MIYTDCDVLVYRIGYGFKDASLDETLNGLENIIQRDILNRLPNDDHTLVLSNTEKTFRHNIAVTAPYKGNRKAEKPQFYHELRNHVMNELGGVMSPIGYEADDYIGVNVNRKTDTIVTTDKDLMMIPAKFHYNFVKDELVKVKRPNYYFWHQLLTGDRADNIVGLNKIGPKTADELLAGAKTKELRSIVEREYKREFGEDWFKRFDENAKLLWIRRSYEKDYSHYV
jgi:5'-3' exonuclease